MPNEIISYDNGEQYVGLGGSRLYLDGTNTARYAAIHDLRSRIAATEDYILEAKKALCPKPATSLSRVYTNTGTSYWTAQGGCSDGTNYYYYLKKRDDENGKLVKINLETGAEIASNSNLCLGHGNDFTYCPDNGLLYCAMTPDPYTVIRISPSTLQIVDTISIEAPIYSIAYDRVNKRFVGVGGYRLHIFDLDMNWDPNSPPQPQSPCVINGWTSQGSECDNLFVYHCYYNGSSTGRIEIYDWFGNYISYLEFSMSDSELEHCSRVGNTLYVSYNYSNGIRLYKCTLA